MAYESPYMILVIFLFLKLFQNQKLKDSLLNTDSFHLVLPFSVERVLGQIVTEKLERIGRTVINPEVYLRYLLYARYCARHCGGFKEVNKT